MYRLNSNHVTFICICIRVSGTARRRRQPDALPNKRKNDGNQTRPIVSLPSTLVKQYVVSIYSSPKVDLPLKKRLYLKVVVFGVLSAVKWSSSRPVLSYSEREGTSYRTSQVVFKKSVTRRGRHEASTRAHVPARQNLHSRECTRKSFNGIFILFYFTPPPVIRPIADA